VSNQIGSGTASSSGNVSELNPTPPEGPVVPPAGMETAAANVFEPGRNVPYLYYQRRLNKNWLS
jgi:hypothetical protein